MNPIRVVACYPRSQSAWLSNLLTVPFQSLYGHDLLPFPEHVRALQRVELPFRGVVDTGATIDNIPEGAWITVIENDLDTVRSRLDRLFGRDLTIEVDRLQANMEALKPFATVLQLKDIEFWIDEFVYEHTGLPLDRRRYMALKNLYIQSHYARQVRFETDGMGDDREVLGADV